MRIAVDVREACRVSPTGKGRWTYCCVTELLQRGVPLILCSDAPLPDAWTALLKKDLHTVYILPVQGLMWHVRMALWLRRASKCTLYLSPVSYLVPLLLPARIRSVLVVHDLIAFLDEPHDARARFIERMSLWIAVRRARAICTVSEATKSDLLQKFPRISPSIVHTVYAGATMELSVPASTRKQHILCVSTLCPRKNQLRLIQAYASLPQQVRSAYDLVLVGKRGWHDAAIVDAAHAEEGVSWRSYLPDADLIPLLEHTAVIAYPSLYEGFGLPVLEAMLAGIPVVTSDRGSLSEVAGNAAFLVDPMDVSSIANGLRRVLCDEELRTTLIAAGFSRAQEFSWTRTVDALLQACKTAPADSAKY